VPYEWDDWAMQALAGIEPYEVVQVLSAHLEDHRRSRNDRWRTCRIPSMGGDAMTHERGLPETPEEAQGFMAGLTFGQPPTPEEEADLLATLPPPGSEVMVVRSVRLPVETELAVEAAAKAAGVPKTTWIRQAIETALVMQAEEDQPISRADALRALTLLRPVRRSAA
jgi:predicted DNA-binding protein